MAIGPDSKEANEAREGCTDHDLSSLKVLARNCSFLRYFLNSHIFPVSDDSEYIRAPTGETAATDMMFQMNCFVLAMAIAEIQQDPPTPMPRVS